MNVYSLLHQATEMIRDNDAFPDPDNAVGACAECQRSFDDVEDPGDGYCWQGSYPRSPKLLLCSTCYTVRAPAPDALGISRFVRGTPVHATLTVNNGCTFLAGLSPEGTVQLHVGTKEGNRARYEKGQLARLGYLHFEDAWPMLIRLLQQRSIRPPFIFVAETAKKQMSLAGTQTTHDLREVWVNTVSGPAYPVDLMAMQDIAKSCEALGLENLARKVSFWKPIRDHAKGKKVTKELEKWAEKIGNPWAVLKHLPDDPLSRDLLGTLVPLFLGKEPIHD